MAAEQQGNKTADIVAESLLERGVEVIFGLPGDGINGFMEALRRRKDRIRFILVRHEESAAFMACAYAKYTSKLGACVATSGPGAIHLLTGLYDAKADNTSVIAIIGQAMAEKRPMIVEAVVDPFEPPMPPKVDMEFVANLAELFAKGQTYARRIGLTLFRNQVHDALRSVHSHDTVEAQ